MKEILMGLFVITTLSLSTIESKAIYESQYQVCAATANVAKAIMNLRQLDTDVVKMMNNAEDDLNRSMIIDAYSQPYYYSQEVKDRAIADFSTKYYLMCLEGFR